jgi:hypothetical protein
MQLITPTQTVTCSECLWKVPYTASLGGQAPFSFPVYLCRS